MNKVIITGKIIRETRKDNVTFITIMARSRKEYEYISVIIFNNEFYNKYFRKDKWITIEGHIHINEHNNTYSTEIVADDIFFVGDPTEMDTTISDYYKNGGTVIDPMP